MENGSVKVCIEKVVYGGDGLGRLPDGRAVFVPFTAPGDEAEVRILREHPRHAEAELCELRTAGAGRTTPRCPHFGRCGGCQYQHLEYGAQVRIKRDQLTESLQRLGRQRDVPPVSELVPAPNPYQYRNKLSLRRFEDESGALRFGLSETDGATLFEPAECHLPKPELWRYLQERLAEFATDPAAVPEGVQRLAVRAPSKGDPFAVFDRGGAEANWVRESVGDADFAVPPRGFWQVNPDVLPALVGIVRNWTRESGRLFVDAYAGVGLFSSTAGAEFEERIVLETDRRALRAARRNHEWHGIGKTRFLPMPTEVALAKQLATSRRVLDETTVLLDPPRTGCARKAVEALNQRRPGQIVYVSCDPATLARDVRALTEEGPYRLVRLALLDMFPQTAHFETVALLEREA